MYSTTSLQAFPISSLWYIPDVPMIISFAFEMSFIIHRVNLWKNCTSSDEKKNDTKEKQNKSTQHTKNETIKKTASS